MDYQIRKLHMFKLMYFMRVTKTYLTNDIKYMKTAHVSS